MVAGPIDLESCIAWSVEVLRAISVPEEQARIIGASLVDADARGVSSHGLRLLPTYVARVRRGDMRADTAVTTVRDAGAAVMLDGGLGFGQVGAWVAIERAAERAADLGVAVVAIRETTHFGALGYFTRAAAAQGFITMAFQNGPTMVPPFGGKTPLLGTNPMSWAVPVAGEEPMVYDVALTAVAGNRVHQLRTKGATEIPAGWMIDAEGRPTTDAVAGESGFLQWAAGHKGYGLAVMVEMLAGVLADASYGATPRTESALTGRDRLAKGGCFIALNPSFLLPEGEFEGRAADLAAQLRASAPASDASPVLVPGDLEDAARLAAESRGLSHDDATRMALDRLAGELGVGSLPG